MQQAQPLPSEPGHADLETDDRALSLVTQFQALGGGIILGDNGLAVTKGFCRAERTEEGWTLYRSGADPRGRFFAEHATTDEAFKLIRDGSVARETEVLTSREQARHMVLNAIRDAYGADSPKGERLLEAVDLLTS